MPTPKRHSDGGDFARLSAGSPYHLVIIEAPVTMDPIAPQFRKEGGPTERERVHTIAVAAPGQVNDDGEDVSGAKVWMTHGFSLHPKAPLRKLAVAVMPRDPKDDDELYKVFDTDKLPGKQFTAIGTYKEGSDYLTVEIFKRLSKAKWLPEDEVSKLIEQYGSGSKSAASESSADEDGGDDDELNF